MAHPHRPVVRQHAARAVRRGLPVARTMALGVVASLAYAGLAGGAFGPSADLPQTQTAKPNLALASLSYSGADPVITGSVDHLFDSISFTGPNRSEKTDRYKPAVEGNIGRQQPAAVYVERIYDSIPMALTFGFGG